MARAFFLLLALLFVAPAARAACPHDWASLAPAHALSAETEARARELFGTILKTEDPAVIARSVDDFRAAVLKAHAENPALRAATPLDPVWPKDGVEYMFYANQFGAKNANGTFREAKRMLPYLEELGVDTLYPLPFLRSPGLDGGFDVQNFYRVDPKLGGNRAFKEFARDAKKRGMKIKMDLVLNHVSDQHEWFQKLLQGDERYKKFFITRDTPPEIVRRYDDGGKVIVYRETGADGKPIEVHRRLIFPDVADSHYREITLRNGKKLWVYHTFYPFQLDLNYENPEVLAEAFKIVRHWADQGVDVFRLDAIPFLDKTAESHPRTHSVVELLSLYLAETAPNVRLKVEACQKLEDIVKYFGKETAKLPSEAHMAYQFDGMAASWLTLLAKDKQHYEKFLENLAKHKMPANAVWANFLRVHDELTLEMIPEAQRKIVQAALLDTKRGVPFREGAGVGGRLAEFLSRDKDRVRMAMSLLLSQDGMPVIYYGDEIAAKNNLGFMAAEETRRGNYFASQGIKSLSAEDSRDAGRGPIARQVFQNARKRKRSLDGATFQAVKKMIAARKESEAMRRGVTEVARNDSENVLTYWRKAGEERVLVVNNLAETAAEVAIEVGDRVAGGTVVRDLITGKEVPTRLENGKLYVPMDRYGALWLKIE